MDPILLFNYYGAIILFMIGFFGIIHFNNLVRKVISLTFIQTAVILFYMSLSVKSNASIPIINDHDLHHTINAAHYSNPLPQALMLTAIVVGVATLGVALTLVISIYKGHKTIEEDEILERLK